jgi:hypothetical protein
MSCNSTDVPQFEIMATWPMLHHVTALFGRSMSDGLCNNVLWLQGVFLSGNEEQEWSQKCIKIFGRRQFFSKLRLLIRFRP